MIGGLWSHALSATRAKEGKARGLFARLARAIARCRRRNNDQHVVVEGVVIESSGNSRQ
jgi:hypothetical protein